MLIVSNGKLFPTNDRHYRDMTGNSSEFRIFIGYLIIRLQEYTVNLIIRL